MLEIIFNNNEIFIKGSKNNDHKRIEKLWVCTRENYINWASEFNQYIQKNKKIINKFKWKSFNTWWLNSLTMKDSEQNNRWLQDRARLRRQLRRYRAQLSRRRRRKSDRPGDTGPPRRTYSGQQNLQARRGRRPPRVGNLAT